MDEEQIPTELLGSGLGGPLIGALGGIGGQLIGQLFAGRNQRRQDESASRQTNLEILNNYLADIARDKAFRPTRSFEEMLRGRAIANLRDVGRFSSEDPGASPFVGRARVPNPDATDPNVLAIQRSLRDPSTFSMREVDGRFIFDPQAFNPLNLAHATGNAREGGYNIAGAPTQYFGRSTSGGGVYGFQPQPLFQLQPQPQPQTQPPRTRPEDLPFIGG